MEFRDLKKQYWHLKKEIDSGIQEVINSSHFILGDYVDKLERELAEYVGRKHCITCANGTDALVLALRCFNISRKDAVFVPDFTYIASASCCSLVGATPVFVDVDDRTFNMSPNSLEDQIEKVINSGELLPKAIIVVDLFGQPAEYDRILSIAKKYNLIVIEDAAQGFGGSIRGKKACSFGDISCTSFFPAKPLGCYGDGGAVFTDDSLVAERLKSLRCGGKSPLDKYDNREIGLNSRLDTIQAAILLPKFHAFREFELDSVNKVSEWYTNNLKEKVLTPVILNGYKSSWAQYSILLQDEHTRDMVQATLRENGVPSMVYYPKALHQQQCFKSLNVSDLCFENTIKLTKRILALPMHPYMDEKEVNYICNIILNVVKGV